MQRLLPNTVTSSLKRYRDVLAALLARTFSATSWTSSLFYLFDRSFRLEHRAVLAGRARYYRTTRATGGSSAFLRRNVHRLEKGLVSRPRRPTFATSFIEETVRAFGERLAMHEGNLDDIGELRWANDVLVAYFDAVASAPAIDRARSAFHRAVDGRGIQERARPLAPYIRDLQQGAAVSFDDFAALCVRRRSVRWFEQRPVPRELIDKAIWAAGQSPTACNRQPFQFLVYDDPDMVQRVAEIPGGAHGFAHNIPAIIVIVGRLGHFFSERDRHLIYIDSSLAAMSLMLGLETLGLSSVPINWPDVPTRERQMVKLIGLERDERVVMLVGVGFPDDSGLVPSSEKRILDDVRIYNRRG